MISLHGYKINKKIYEGSNSIIYRGVSDKEGIPVVIKMLNGEFPSPEQLARFRREFEMTRRHTGSNIIKAHKLEKHNNTLVIILEDFGGESLTIKLADKKPDIKEILSLEIRMTKALEQVHSHHIIHKDVNPTNFIWNPETDQLKIIDFGISTELTRETTEIESPDVLEGTLSYISPEQTGRMNKSIDYRSDFYSLGITFYQILTGQFPFYSDDPMGIVYSHIARVPLTPSKLKSEIPVSLSEIVMKLLSKSAEDRYQSASALIKDLEHCLKQIELTGTIASFNIAQNDISDRFQIPQTLYGREKEINQLIGTFERVAEQGTSEILMVSGHSGIGKSSLINEVQKTIVEKHGYFISGKFDQLKRDIPYSSLIQAFKGLIQQLLSEREERVASTRKKLLNALEPNGQIIIDVIPEVELIIGKQPDVLELPPERARSRFKYTFQKFIGCLSAHEHPLVLFIDDLHWVDASSLQLINVIMNEPDIGYMLIIGAFRDNEVHIGHPLLITLAEIEKSKKINTVRLFPLELSHVNQLISETLSLTPEKSMKFADLCFNKTLGNPFFLNQFLHMLYRSDAIIFNRDKGCWQWDIIKIQQMEVTDNVVDLMISKIEGLPQNTQTILSLAACIGAQFDLKILSKMHKKSMKDTANDLWKGLKEDLVEPVDKSYKYVGLGDSVDESDTLFMIPTYRFLHDRIQQAAYQIIEENQKLSIHWEIGKMMLEIFSEDERSETLFDVVGHLNLGNIHATTQEEKDQLVALNLKAGLKAKDSAAYEASFYYLQEGIRFLGEKAWERTESLALEVYTQAAESAYLSGDFKQTEILAQIVLQNTKELMDQVKIYEIRILSNIAQNRLKEANNIGIKILKMLGIHLHENPSKARMVIANLKVKFNLQGKKIEHLADLPEMTDSYMLASVRILSRIMTSSLFYRPYIAALAIFKQMILALKFGNAASTSYAYATYGIVLCAFGHIDTGFKFGQLALQLAEHPQFKQYKSRSILTAHVFINHWKNHKKESLSSFINAYNIGIESGDPEAASYSLVWHYITLPLSGIELKLSFKKDYIQHLHAIKKLNVDTGTYSMEIATQFFFNLTTETTNPCCLIGDYYDETLMLPIHEQANDGFTLHLLYVLKLILSYLMEDYNLAIENGNKCKKYLLSASAMITVPVAYFYHSLARLASYQQMDTSKQKQLLKKTAISQKHMKLWADHAPMNFLHKYHLVEAELARVLKQTDKAIEHYKRSIKEANKSEYINEEALANELFAKFWLNNNTVEIAQVYMKKAHHLYQIWGAIIKVADLEKKYSFLLKEVTATLLNTNTIHTSMNKTGTTSETLDIDSIMKSSHAFSSITDLRLLLKKVLVISMENAGAQKGALLLENNGELFIEAEGHINGNYSILNTIPLNTCASVCIPIIKSVMRRKKSIVLNDASHEGDYLSDNYIVKNKPKSVLVVPVIHQDNLTGVLYLENNSVTRAFTPERIKFLQVLTIQAAISIKIARQSNQLSIANKELLHSKNIAENANKTKTAFLATMAHEFRTPLSGIEGELQLLKDSVAEHSLTDSIEHIDNISASSKRLMASINDVLDFSELESGTLVTDISVFNITRRIEKIPDMFKDEVQLKNLMFKMTIDPSVPEFIEGDEKRIIRCLLCLLENSIKFTTTGSINLNITYKDDAHLDIEVEDTGKGITKDKLNQIFNAFWQSQKEQSFTKPFEGLGLGLSITAKVIQLMNGTINAESVEGKGSKFSLSIPAKRVDNQTIANVDLSKLNTLIVEDNKVNALILRSFLKKLNIPSEIAENGKVGVEKFSSGKFNLILMDVQMPVMNGIEATIAIRKAEAGQGKRIPIICVTANAKKRDCIDSGMDAFIQKPLSQDVLSETIIDVLLRQTVQIYKE